MHPPYIAHPCTDWDDEHVARHLETCQQGRDPATWQWHIDPADSRQVWAYLWETMGKPRTDGSIDFGPWPVREIEIP